MGNIAMCKPRKGQKLTNEVKDKSIKQLEFLPSFAREIKRIPQISCGLMVICGLLLYLLSLMHGN